MSARTVLKRGILCVAFALLVLVTDCPAMDMAAIAPATKKTTTVSAAETPAKVPGKKKPKTLKQYYQDIMGEESPYRSVILAVLTLLLLLFIKKHTTRLLVAYVSPRAYKSENADKFLRTWNSVWKFVIGVMVIIALSGSLQLLGLSAAFLGMMLGWSLQAPVTGIAAWLMILLKRPFRIGDRVVIAGIIGDVKDINLTHIVLNQVGGTVGGEEPSGRGVLIPTAILFGQVIMNYTLEEQYMLDEVPVRLTFDSDYELAKKILLQAAQETMADIIKETGQEPFLRSEFFDAGVMVRLRYQTIPARRQEFSSLIVEKVMHGFKENYPKVKFCYPQSTVYYHWEDNPQENGAISGSADEAKS